MKIAIASDHAGFQYKEALKEFIVALGFEVTDFGPDSEDSIDYPDFAHLIAEKISKNIYEKGLLICGSGIGMAMAANKHINVRAAVLRDSFDAEMSRKHNNSNIACLGARATSLEDCKKLLEIWFNTSFEGGRHEKRVSKIDI